MNAAPYRELEQRSEVVDELPDPESLEAIRQRMLLLAQQMEADCAELEDLAVTYERLRKAPR